MSHSMTGFARFTHDIQPWQLTWELKSVNHRYLEIQCNLPESLRQLEPQLRQIIKENIHRGKLDVQLKLSTLPTEAKRYSLNPEALHHLSGLIASLSTQLPDQLQLNALDVLNFPGILQAECVDIQKLEQHALTSFNHACRILVEARHAEGEQMSAHIQQLLTQLAAEIAQIQAQSEDLQQTLTQKLQERVKKLIAEVEQDRLAQEVIFYAQKYDIKEEIVRLESHSKKLAKLLMSNKPIGRELDFLLQELNREANTLGAKAVQQQVVYHALNCKVIIEQMREQTQNIE